MTQTITRRTLALGLIKYDGLSREDAVKVMAWKCSDAVLDRLSALSDPLSADVEGMAPLQYGSPFLAALTKHFGLKLAVVNMIFKKGV